MSSAADRFAQALVQGRPCRYPFEAASKFNERSRGFRRDARDGALRTEQLGRAHRRQKVVCRVRIEAQDACDINHDAIGTRFHDGGEQPIHDATGTCRIDSTDERKREHAIPNSQHRR